MVSSKIVPGEKNSFLRDLHGEVSDNTMNQTLGVHVLFYMDVVYKRFTYFISR